MFAKVLIPNIWEYWLNTLELTTFPILTKLSHIYPFLNANICIKRFLHIDIPYIFINKIEDINAIIGQQQLENILTTFYLIENNKEEKIDSIKKNNIQKCIQWCIKNNLPYINIIN